MDSLESLVEDYKSRESSMTEREKATLERRIWALRPEGVSTSTKGKADWFFQLLEAASSRLHDRSRLLNRGDVAAPLWVRVEGEMTVATALHILVRSEELRET